ncbi:flagellar export chaperone FliS [Maricurvus nonylphenolicus]|uniref:flagellar export chaperone FliS n=1 Tax=Maricurvus nonylphenolicus TaxID=1008307 RepID=UPI0036F269B5
MATNPLSQYKQVDLETRVNNASPHKLIQMLYEGAIERLSIAKGALAREDMATKGIMLGKAISILSGLRDSLDKGVESDLPDNLDRLYEYMQFRLLEANRDNDQAGIEEVLGLIKTVKSGWDEIAPKV